MDDAEEGKTYTYTYDDGGNLTEEKTFSYQTADTVTGTELESHTYAYTNQWKDLLTSYDGTAITYDGIGNPLNYMGKSLPWQRGRELATVTTSEGTWQYSYDDNGYRTEKTAPDGSTTKYYRNGTMLLAQVTASDRLDFFYDEKGQPLGFKYSVPGTGAQPATSLYYYRMNLQGDIEGILDASGNEVCSYTYDAWGRPLGLTGSAAATIGVKNPLRYRGYFYDEETGLYYVSSRYYNPEVGRFLNADSAIGKIGIIQSHNLYVYAFDNPVIYTDPNGDWPKLSTVFTVIAVGALCVATGGLASAVIAGGGSTLIAAATTTAALGVTVTAAKVAAVSAGAAVVSKAVEKSSNQRKNEKHTVYKLVDGSGEAQYVGRTKDLKTREDAHKKNPHRASLTLQIIEDNLSYEAARGIEQTYMLYYHTINTNNKMNNQINGISPRNGQKKIYIIAAEGVLGYMWNQVSNEILYWSEN